LGLHVGADGRGVKAERISPRRIKPAWTACPLVAHAWQTRDSDPKLGAHAVQLQVAGRVPRSMGQTTFHVEHRSSVNTTALSICSFPLAAWIQPRPCCSNEIFVPPLGRAYIQGFRVVKLKAGQNAGARLATLSMPRSHSDVTRACVVESHNIGEQKLSPTKSSNAQADNTPDRGIR